MYHRSKNHRFLRAAIFTVQDLPYCCCSVHEDLSGQSDQNRHEQTLLRYEVHGFDVDVYEGAEIHLLPTVPLSSTVSSSSEPRMKPAVTRPAVRLKCRKVQEPPRLYRFRTNPLSDPSPSHSLRANWLTVLVNKRLCTDLDCHMYC